jgi:hypothetical protein
MQSFFYNQDYSPSTHARLPGIMIVLALALFAAAGCVSAKNGTSTKPFTDPATGISFQAYTNAGGFKFGIALPKTGSKDLVGFLVCGFTWMPCQFAA